MESNELNITKHPLYNKFVDIWRQQRDCYEGENSVKAGGTRYLPVPSGLAAEKGYAEFTQDITYPIPTNTVDNNLNLGDNDPSYLRYKRRADFPEILSESVSAMSGLIFQDSGNVDLPSSMEYLVENAAKRGKGLLAVMRDTVKHQLVEGRVFWVWTVDVKNNRLRLEKYTADEIIDWHEDEDGNLISVVLDESQYVYNEADNSWSWEKIYRVCSLDGAGRYYTGLIQDDDFDFKYPPPTVVYEKIRGVVSNKFPGVIFNSVDTHADPSMPMTTSISEAALKAYMVSADLSQSMHLMAQPTLAGFGFDSDQDIVLGSRNMLVLSDPTSKAHIEILEVQGNGLKIMQSTIDEYKTDARRHVELIEKGSESGVALNTRLSIKTANLQGVALNLQDGFTQLLQVGATWMGAPVDAIQVQVNTDFRKFSLSIEDIVQLSGLVTQGLMTLRDFYQALVTAKRTTYETYEEWKAEIDLNGFASTIEVDEEEDIDSLDDVEDEDLNNEET